MKVYSAFLDQGKEGMEDSQINDEIDLKQLITSVLETRVWVFVGLIVVSAIFWGIQATLYLTAPNVLSYESRINLIFNGASERSYPNGSPFTINDVISPVVLHSVYENNGLSDFIGLRSFVSSFSVRPYTPDRNLILAKYTDLLESKNLSIAEIDQLQKGLNDELSRASVDAVTITFSGKGLETIPKILVEKVMRDVPGEWARHMIEEVGVGEFREAIYTSGVLDESVISNMDYLIAFEMLLDRLELLQRNILVIKELPNGLVVADEESGLSLPDLEKAVFDVKRYRVAPLINPVRSLGIAKNPELVQLYFENELIELKRGLEVHSAKRKNISEAYSNYLQSGSGQQGSSASTMNSVTTQIEPEFFDKIVELTNSGADIIYRQELNTLFLETSDKMSEAEAEIARIEQILSSMKGQNTSTQILRESYSSQVNEQLPSIIEQLSNYFRVSERLYKKLSAENLGSARDMFRFADGESSFTQSNKILSMSNLRLFIIVCFLTVIVIVPVVMIRKSLLKD
tara:strand:- start:1435 stop:2982 length:1548 start_codon:yes stop_codon:yes gene_type:complete